MEAHKVKYGATVKVMDKNVIVPPASLPVKTGDILTIRRLDGMYCNAENQSGERVYIAGWTEVEPIN